MLFSFDGNDPSVARPSLAVTDPTSHVRVDFRAV
jgi:hypothetical protein